MTQPRPASLQVEPAVALRPAEVLMKPDRLAAIQPSRLSVSRALIARMTRERWDVQCLSFDIDERAKGTALYRITTPGGIFDFPVFSFEFNPAGRTGRIIGRNWDMMGALVEGPMSAAEIEHTQRELPKLYAGRATERTLVWARSNRSSRAFDHVVDSLSAGRQPELSRLSQVCYLMRNTGLDGNGTFGTRSFRALESNHALRNPLAAQMLSAYMMREFATDLVTNLARHRAGSQAVSLDPAIRRFLGVGNGSALGLILFANNHPRLLDRFLHARETALAHAKGLSALPGSPEIKRLQALLDRVIRFRLEDRTVYDALVPSDTIAAELAIVHNALNDYITTGHIGGLPSPVPLAALCDHLEDRVLPETQETLHSLLIELVPELADSLCETMIVSEETTVAPAMRVGELRQILRDEYAWCFAMDLSTEASRRYIWYKSATAEEPRRGPREEVEQAFNLGLDLPRLIQQLDVVLASQPADRTMAHFLLGHPEQRGIVARVQTLRGLRYHSPHMNIMAEDFIPIQMVRLLNVGLHGIDKTRDFLNRNLRGVLYHGAPLPEDLRTGTHGDWFYPAEPV
ncbi:hypothetical protein [Ferrovibrio terrae]|uniref:hypothetical protein n=1 Tax=Ferrovibrio terrae TaxID=2594003 RepID=UPI003137C9B9